MYPPIGERAPLVATVLHQILGALETSAPGFWDAAINFGDRAISFELTIGGPALTAADLDDLPQKPEDLVPLDRTARAAILRDAQSEDEDSAAKLC